MFEARDGPVNISLTNFAEVCFLTVHAGTLDTDLPLTIARSPGDALACGLMDARVRVVVSASCVRLYLQNVGHKTNSETSTI